MLSNVSLMWLKRKWHETGFASLVHRAGVESTRGSRFGIRPRTASNNARNSGVTSSTAKNLKRIAESVEAHDANCEAKAKAVMLNPYEFERLGFDHVTTKAGRRVPIKEDQSLGTGRLRVVCDGYHGPKKEIEREETVEAPSPAERELVPAGAPEEA